MGYVLPKFSTCNTDTHMYVEAFHNGLKTFYMDRKPIKRVDDLLNVVENRRWFLESFLIVVLMQSVHIGCFTSGS